MNIVSSSLCRRIVASVALGLTFILVLFGFVALWRVSESVEAAYRGRVMVAQTLVDRLDDTLRYYLLTLEREAQQLTASSGYDLEGARQRLVASVAISVADAKGMAVKGDSKVAEFVVGSRLRHPGVEAVLRTGASYAGQVSGDEGKALACLAVPVRDRSGALSGVLVAEFDPSHPGMNFLPLETRDDGFHAQLINTDGELLAGSEGWNPRSTQQHRDLLADLIENRQSGYNIHEPPAGRGFPSHVVAYAPSQVMPAWGMTVEQSSDVLLATSRNMMERQILFGIAALLAAIALTWFDVRRVVRPLKTLTLAAERFAAGQLDEPVGIKREDEIGILAAAFDTMRVRVRALLAEVAEWNHELERRVAARTAEVERRNRELAQLNAVVTAVSGSLDVGPMLEITLDSALEMTGAESGCFWMIGRSDAEMTPAARRGALIGCESKRPCAYACLCRRVVRLNQTLIATPEDLDIETSICGAAGLRSAVAVPVPSGDRVQAVLLIASSRPDCFAQVEMATLTAVARQVGVALEKALLYRELQRKEELRGQLLEKVIVAQEEERKRVARELHDELAQELPALIMSLEAVKRSLPPSAKEAAENIERAEVVANVTLGEVRKLIADLRPSALDDLGLVPAIRWYGERYLEERGVKFDCRAIGFKKRLPAQLETALFRIIQEAINNVSKHAHATSMKVRLEMEDSVLSADIEDDGVGFDLSAVHRRVDSAEGLGLMGMQERVALFGGEFNLESQVGKGTRIRIRVPIGAEEKSE